MPGWLKVYAVTATCTSVIALALLVRKCNDDNNGAKGAKGRGSAVAQDDDGQSIRYGPCWMHCISVGSCA